MMPYSFNVKKKLLKKKVTFGVKNLRRPAYPTPCHYQEKKSLFNQNKVIETEGILFQFKLCRIVREK